MCPSCPLTTYPLFSGIEASSSCELFYLRSIETVYVNLTMDFLSPEVRRNPYPIYRRMREVSPVLHLAAFNAWMVFDYEGVKRVLNDHEAFSSKVGPEWLIFLDPPRHAKLRALISRAFTPKVIAGIEPRIRALSRRLLDEQIHRGEMDLVADYSLPLPMTVIAEMIGIPAADLHQFDRWSQAIQALSLDLVGGAEGMQAVNDYRAATAEMDEYLARMIRERRASPGEDLLSRLIEAEVDGERLTQREILLFFQLLVVAGQETTTDVINNAILCLLEHPEQLSLLRQRMALLPSAVEEVLRYRAPLQWTPRTPRHDVELHGRVIRAGERVLAVIGAANRDPAHFPDADRFDIARRPNPHMSFGHGIHFCLGAPLARMEARIALADLLERLKGLELASDQPWEPRRALHVHGPDHLMIRFVPGAAV